MKYVRYLAFAVFATIVALLVGYNSHWVAGAIVGPSVFLALWVLFRTKEGL